MTNDPFHAQSCAYGQGRATAERGGYRSDNPHPYQSELWEAWLAGFDEEEGPTYTVKK